VPAWKIVELAVDGELKKFSLNDVIAVFPDRRVAAVVALSPSL
jgi:hypothetical protein